MTTIFARSALLTEGWADNVLIEVDKDGWITGIDTFKAQPTDPATEIVAGPLVPGMSNVHSHAFQRALAGLAERAGSKKNNFWGWRDTMYRFIGSVDPEDMGDLAAQVYVEMLKAGYTSVGEFHYVHHQADGTPYNDRAIMSRSIVQAALDSGIALTHMPSLYAFGGFGHAPAAEGQKRFLNDVSGVMRIVEEIYGEYRNTPQISVGFAPHSLRAVSGDMLLEGVSAFRKLLPEAPVHILVAAQSAEVEACVEWSGKRPVQWLIDNAGVDRQWCLVHATHIDTNEMSRLVASGAVVGLCPSASANLGDGIFPLTRYFNAGGAFAIGSGSHATINMLEELRWLEYLQRMTHHERTLLATPEIPSVGATLYDRAAYDGGRALGRRSGRIEIGWRADFVVLDAELPSMTAKVRDHVLDAAIFAGGENPVRDVMAGGRWVVRDRHHKREEQALQNFRKALKKLH